MDDDEKKVCLSLPSLLPSVRRRHRHRRVADLPPPPLVQPYAKKAEADKGRYEVAKAEYDATAKPAPKAAAAEDEDEECTRFSIPRR